MAQSTAAAAVLAEDSEQIKQLVSFILGKEEFGVDILMVQEVNYYRLKGGSFVLGCKPTKVHLLL